MNLELVRMVDALTEEEEDEVVSAIVRKRERKERCALRAVQARLESIRAS